MGHFPKATTSVLFDILGVVCCQIIIGNRGVTQILELYET